MHTTPQPRQTIVIQTGGQTTQPHNTEQRTKQNKRRAANQPKQHRHTKARTTSTMATAAVRRLVPLLDRVLIEKIAPPTKTAGGILLPEQSVTKMNEGKVIAVGPGAIARQTGATIPISVKEGDKVLLPEFGGQPIKIDGKDFHVYRDEELIGVLHD